METSSVVIRAATAEDIPVILEFIAKKAEFDRCPEAVEATPEKIRETLFGDAPLAGILLAEVEGRAVGFASYFYTYSTFLARPGIWLDDLFVNVDRRSRRIGWALMQRLARLAGEKGCGRIEWTAGAHNERGLTFYRRHGARVSENARLCRLDRDAIASLAAGNARSVE
jgi:GNAT superfamily N-acetyltransferase